MVLTPYLLAANICMLLYLGLALGRRKLIGTPGRTSSVTVIIRALEKENLEQILKWAAFLSDEGAEIVVSREGLSSEELTIAENYFKTNHRARFAGDDDTGVKIWSRNAYK